MYMGSPVAAAAIKTHRTNAIGVGLRPNPAPDAEFLGLSPQEAAAWGKDVKREFSLWASRKGSCDAAGMNDFYELQQLLFMSWLCSGDAFALVCQEDPGMHGPYGLRLAALEADLVATPPSGGAGLWSPVQGKNLKNGNRIFDGVEVDAAGKVAAYHVRDTYPFEPSERQTAWRRIPAFGERTGLPKVLHLMNAERPGQYRGVSYLAQAIIPLLQLNRYTEAELSAALTNSYLTGYVQTNAPEGTNPLGIASPDEAEEIPKDPSEYEIGPGQMAMLKPGENIVFADPKHPSSGFAAFFDAVCAQVGAALEVPKEVLIKQFNASYSASRGALLEAWKSFRMYRTWFVNDFCRPTYEIWMHEAVARGRISAPGFFADPAIREAWLSCQWIGPSQGMLEPVKEITAEALACQHGFSTREASALRLNGSDFGANTEKLVTENEMLQRTQATKDAERDTGGSGDSEEGGGA